MSGSSEMDAEFDTVAEWTADVALELGSDYLIAAGCRGSGGPRSLERLLDALEVEPSDRMLDVGAGIGGPAAFAARRCSVRPVLAEPERGACRAAHRMFGLDPVRADATALPFATGAFDVVWSIAVLCTVDDHRAALAELARVASSDGRIGLLVYEAQHKLSEQPEGNNFPSADGLAGAEAVGLRIAEKFEMSSSSDAEPGDWQHRLSRVERELERRHRADDAWRSADRQSTIMGQLISERQVVGQLLVLRRA